MNAPNGGIIAKMDKNNLISLMNLKTITNTVNDIYKHDSTIDNVTNDTTNTKDVNNHFVNIQNGFRIVGKDYKFSNHMNKGYEEFGLMQLDAFGDFVPTPSKKVEAKKKMSYTDWFKLMTYQYPTDYDDGFKEIEMIEFPKHMEDEDSDDEEPEEILSTPLGDFPAHKKTSSKKASKLAILLI